jgi:small-conductance mechanosensitive channel
MAEETATGYIDGRIDAVREHIGALIAAAPNLPSEFARVAGEVSAEWQRGTATPLVLILGFVLLGLAVEATYRHVVDRISVHDQTVRERLRSIGLRLARELGAIAAFAAGSAAVFLAFDWPARTRQAVVGFFVGLILWRITVALSRALFAPGDARVRILPGSDAEAAFWHKRVRLFTGWFALGWVIFGWLAVLGMELPSRQLVAYVLGLGLLAIAIEASWRQSRLAAIYFVLLWVLWAVRALGFLWLAVVAAALPLLMRLAQRGADHALRPAGAAAAETRGVLAAAIGRGLRALAILGAAILLVYAFNLDVDALAESESFLPRLARGALQALAIVLLADLAWLIAASLIDRNLATAQADAASDEEANRRSRLRTLLPILRGALAVVLVVMASLMALSALGIQVGALLAGAGVIGIAVGFGAQTLVRDMFSKFFYLLDDAFRVGEYIQSGNYKGTVEHLGARSLRLRHHRGPVFTVPYGQLGAVQNMSRDWVIDKLTINLTYDSDLDKAKKIIKQIGKELAANEEFAPNILEPLKMQGVEQFGDFAIQIRMKMKTKPGQQFTIRRRAYAMIRTAFEANGIKFAHPTVQVAGSGEAASAAAARQALELKKVS